MPETVYHLEAWFAGRVQGVGFRFTTLEIARGFEVSGTIKNLSDGRVWLCVEGNKTEVESFLKSLTEEMSAYITEVSTKTKMAASKMTGFNIGY